MVNSEKTKKPFLRKAISALLILFILIPILGGCQQKFDLNDGVSNAELQQIKDALASMEPTPGTGSPSDALIGLMSKWDGLTKTAKDIQYDVANNIETPFGIEGIAELDDYFNYGYDKLDRKKNFCIKLTADDGDIWYLYADRTGGDDGKMKEPITELYQRLVNEGSASIACIAQIYPAWYEEDQQGNMAIFEGYWVER